jgi:very-short-patch-repair endonuclease
LKSVKRAGPRPDLNECKTFDFLYHHLVVLGKSKKQLADELGVSQPTMNAWTEPFDFGVNFHSQSQIGKHSSTPSDEIKLLLSEKIRQQYLDGRRPVNYKEREVRSCEVCGSEFEVIRDSENEKQRNKTTCSRACADKKHSLYMQSRPAQVEKISIKCEQCGASFVVYPSLAHVQFCSYECARANRRGKTYLELYGAERELEVKQKLASARSRQSQNFMTRPVLTLLSSLIPLLGEPEIEYQIGVYTVDICYPSLYVVIEVDGNYWHNFPFGLARDKRKTQFLEELGWKVFRYWEKDILSDPVAIATEIKEKI